ncbi:hypothetical protein KC19_11G058500 [Ceratodon purpureus]|uniref:Secreted protein n=1 Tax=Ceratodon purpureus TaxID=3225 RepID=A0A8T0GH53_CERPU|nr:hypothetical protein KC19_11G058500 [Ceratodon purpureus]
MALHLIGSLSCAQTLHAALTLQQPHASPLLLLLARHRRHAALLLIVLQPLCPASTSQRFDMLSGRTTMAGPETRVTMEKR